MKNISNINIALWLFQKGLVEKKITDSEKLFSKELSLSNFKDYSYSRGYTRYVLGQLFRVNPLEVPLYSIPGNQPKLKKGWGYLSLSHCQDAILIGWSSNKIGVDIENKNRKMPFKKLCDRFFTSSEKKTLNIIKKTERSQYFLGNWVMKESAFKCQTKKKPEDLYKWEWDRTLNICSNERIDEEFKFNLIQYKNWTIGAATGFLNDINQPIVCVN